MGRRKRRQVSKYAAQFMRTAANKRRNFLKHHPDGGGSVPTARMGKGPGREPVIRGMAEIRTLGGQDDTIWKKRHRGSDN
jgi:hypothetical protein